MVDILVFVFYLILKNVLNFNNLDVNQNLLSGAVRPRFSPKMTES
jgi:hypothetical protein